MMRFRKVFTLFLILALSWSEAAFCLPARIPAKESTLRPLLKFNDISESQIKRTSILEMIGDLDSDEKVNFVKNISSRLSDEKEIEYVLDFIWRNDRDNYARHEALEQLLKIATMDKKYSTFMPFRQRFFKHEMHKSTASLIEKIKDAEIVFEPLRDIKNKESVKKILLVKMTGTAKGLGNLVYFFSFIKLKRMFPKAKICFFSRYPGLLKDKRLEPVFNIKDNYDLVIDIENQEEFSKILKEKQKNISGYYIYYSFRPPIYYYSPLEPIGVFQDFRNEGIDAQPKYILNRFNSLRLNGYTRVLNSISGLGMENGEDSLRIETNEKDREEGLKMLQDLGCIYVRSKGRFLKPVVFVDLNCDSRVGLKDWAMDDAVNFLTGLLKKEDIYLVLNNWRSEKESVEIRDIYSRLNELLDEETMKDIFVGPHIGLEQFVLFLSCVDLGISFDTGTAHILGALGKPTLTIFNLGYDTMIWQPPQKNVYTVSSTQERIFNYQEFSKLAPISIQGIYSEDGWVSVRIPRILRWEDPQNPEFEQRQNASPAEAVSLAMALIKIDKGEVLDFFERTPSIEELRHKLYIIRHAYIDLLNSGYKNNKRKETLESRLFQYVNELKALLRQDYYNIISYDRDLVMNNLDNMTVVEDILRNSNLMKFITLLLTNLKKEEDSYAEQLQMLSMPTVSRDKILQVYEIIFNNPLIRSKDICESTGLTREELMAVYRYMQLNPFVQDMLIAKSSHSYYTDILGSVSHDDRDFWEAVFKGEKRFPVEVEFHTSLWCPFDCEYCYSRNVRYLDLKYYKNLPHLSKEERLSKISDLIKELANGGTKRIYFSGGKEPTVDPFTFEIMKIAHDNGLEVIVNTDGVNLDGCGARFKDCRKVRERGEISIMNTGETKETYRDDDVFKFYLKNSTKIRISMDFIRKEDKEAYNKSKNLSLDDPALDRIRESISRLVQLRRGIKGRAAKIEVALLVIPENAMLLEETAEELKKLGVDSFVIRHINPTTSTQQVRPQEDMIPYLENIRKKYEKDPAFNLEIRFEDFNKDRNLFGKDSKIRRSTRCWRAEYKTVFNPFGANIACCYTAHPGYEKMWGQNFILNPDETIYKASSFRDYWMRDDVIKRRTKEILASKCKACLMADRAINNAVEKVKDDFEFGIPLDTQPFIRSSILNPEGVFKEWGQLLTEKDSDVVVSEDLRYGEIAVLKDVIKKELDEELSDTEASVLNSLLSKAKELEGDYLLKKFVRKEKDIERLRNIIYRSTFLNRFIKLSGNHETKPSKFLKDSYTDI